MDCEICGKSFELRRISKGRLSFQRRCDGCRYVGRRYATTHGHTCGGQSPTYRVWHGIQQRCDNPNHLNFAQYGGRGIRLCERWRSFENFLADMGERPAGLTIDRIDGDGDYEPDNCRWATMKEQSNNWRGKRNTRVIYFGSEYTLQELSDRLQLDRYTLRRRIFDMKWPQDRWAARPLPRNNLQTKGRHHFG